MGTDPRWRGGGVLGQSAGDAHPGPPAADL